MGEFQNIHEAHHELVEAVSDATKPGFDPIPISIVSVKPEVAGQLVIFDGLKFNPREVAKRLRLAADLIDQAAEGE